MSGRSRRRARMSVALAALIPLVSVSCGIDFDTTPRPLAGESDVTTTTPAEPGTSEVVLYVVRSDRLAGIRGRVPTRSAEAVLTALLAGPLDGDAQSGVLTSAIPSGTELRSVEVADGTATVDLSSAFGDVQGLGRQLAVAQIVSTLTQLGGVERVTFRIEGAPIKVPSPAGDTQVVGPCDYLGEQPTATDIAEAEPPVREALARRMAQLAEACPTDPPR